MRIVSIGECMVEMAPGADGRFAMGFAGDTFNTAWYLRQTLPAGWQVDYATAIGDDCVFRELWALISRDLGRAFRAIMGSHFADAGRLADGFMESGLIGSVKRFRDIGPASEAFS